MANSVDERVLAKGRLETTMQAFHTQNDLGMAKAELLNRAYIDTLLAFNMDMLSVTECKRNCLEVATAKLSKEEYKGKEKERSKAVEIVEKIRKELYPESPYDNLNSITVNYVMRTVGINTNTRAEEVASMMTNLKIAVLDKQLPAETAQKHVDELSSAKLEDPFANKLRSMLFDHQSEAFSQIGIVIPKVKPAAAMPAG